MVVSGRVEHEDPVQSLHAIVHLQDLRQLVAILHEDRPDTGVSEDVQNLVGWKRLVHGHDHQT